ncbi:MAG: hypothetical protein Q8S73_12525, partial [Deltaproteobacteria bacterium]|nr:hypothetical protein [Deltaproteobacteria bacterium]
MTSRQDTWTWWRQLTPLLLVASIAACNGNSVVGGADAGGTGMDAPTDVVTPCPTGTTRCGDRCVSTDSDRANCGACGQSCSAGTVCVAGS